MHITVRLAKSAMRMFEKKQGTANEDNSTRVWSPFQSIFINNHSHSDFVTLLTRLADGGLISTSRDGSSLFWGKFDSFVAGEKSL